MIGQQKIINQIDKLIQSGFPRFIIITGAKGQGKKTLANYISKQLKYLMVISDVKIDSIREIIDLAYKQTEPIIYLIPDADKMSIGAKNSMLKVIEEPPNSAYFILTLESIENTLPTIKSRCIQLDMQSYSGTEKLEFINKLQLNLSDDDKNIILNCCDNCYEISMVNSYGVRDFYNYCKKVCDNIYKVQSANSFKILEKIQLKDEDNKYSPELFLKLVRKIWLDELLTAPSVNDKLYYHECITITSTILNKLRINGINKLSLLDMWILAIRKVWFGK